MLHRLPNGFFNSFEGGIALEADFVWRIRDLFKRIFLEPDSVEKLIGPPYRRIRVVRGDRFWNFKQQKFTEYNIDDCNLVIHRRDETNYVNFFNSYVREHEKNPNH